jgi:hypothetical protein
LMFEKRRRKKRKKRDEKEDGWWKIYDGFNWYKFSDVMTIVLKTTHLSENTFFLSQYFFKYILQKRTRQNNFFIRIRIRISVFIRVFGISVSAYPRIRYPFFFEHPYISVSVIRILKMDFLHPWYVHFSSQQWERSIISIRHPNRLLLQINNYF